MKKIEGLYFVDGVAVEKDLQNGKSITIAFADSNKTALRIANGLNWLDEMEEADQIEREGENKE
jgi:transcription initiation factor TFIIIB Brf1 subunit/transcription initiation factor TFIIB|tara:strand:+ start:318 stop:509 length:192 start_codon:yes stop_codon:yes gene_type:complete